MKTKEIIIQPGCKKVEIDFENNRMIAFYEEKQEFKRGDYYTSLNTNNIVCIIEKSNEDNTGFYTIAAIDGCGLIYINDDEIWLSGGYRQSTPEEIALLDQKLLELGYKFNKETLELEKVDVFKDKDIVLVRDGGSSIWQLRAFRDKYGILFICYGADEIGEPWPNCIKYYGNEHLLGTKNKPE